MGGDRDGTIEIVMRITKESGIVTETVLTSFTIKNIEQRVSVLVFSKLEIHLKEQVVYHSGELIPMSHHEFFTLLYLAQHQVGYSVRSRYMKPCGMNPEMAGQR